MKVAILKHFGDLHIEDWPKPQLKPRYVLVRVKAASLCGTDVKEFLGEAPIPLPRVLGHDFSGIVEEVGDGVDTSWRGQKVGVDTSFPCGKCEFCRKNLPVLCEHKKLIGLYSDGCFQEYVLTPESNLLRLPDHVSFEESAVLEPFTGALNTFTRLNINIGDSIVVLGQGPMGLGQTALAKLSGAGEIITTDIRKEVLVVSRNYGATMPINAKEEDAVKKIMQITDNKGADVVIESAGSSETAKIMPIIVKQGGKLVYQGGVHGKLGIDTIKSKRMTVYGIGGNGGRDQHQRALNLISRGLIDPKKMISHIFVFEEIGKVFQILSSEKERANEKVIKAVLKF